MAKNKVSEWSSVAANNTDVGGIDIAEGCAPSGINNGIRELMAQVKDMITGADGDSQVVGGNLTVNGTSTLTGAVVATAGVTGATTGAHNGSVGATTPSTGTFTTLSSTGNTTLGDASADTLTVNATPTFNVAIPVASGGTGSSTASGARTNLGVTATGSDTTYAYRANNLSDLASASTARTNLGLGTLSTQNSNSVSITGGTVAATFTGNLTGNVTGNVSGSSGSCTGNSATATLSTDSTNAIGYSQSWQDLSSSRSLSTSYTNSTGKPIQVSVNARSNVAAYIQASVGGITLIGSDNAGSTGPRMFISFIVPNSASYSVSLSAGSLVSGSLQWAELR